jgi:AraC-like DNA-binding protein
LTQLVRHRSTLAAPEPANNLSSLRLQRVTDYIEARLGDDLSLMTLAAEARISPPHLAWGFRHATGRSMHQYVLRRRVEEAAALLVRTEHPIAEVALLNGSLASLTSRPPFTACTARAQPSTGGRGVVDLEPKDAVLRRATGYKLANDRQDTRAIQHSIGHKNIAHTTRYTNLAPDRFKMFWRD